MIVLISPAKTLDFSSTEQKLHSQPRLLDKSESLVKELRKKSVRSIKKLMDVSEAIASLNVERFQQFQLPFDLKNAKQAALAFKGDVYQGLDADQFKEGDWDFAQKHLRILSGLYGLLKPLDLIQPYRLEMGTALKKGRKKNLYEFWDKKITDLINEDLKESEGPYIVNLASKEYFKSVKPALLDGQLVTINFKENRGGAYKVISFNAKKARGVLSRLIIQHKMTNPNDTKELEVDGYLYNPELSTESEFLFTKETN